ncbi:MAG TPA: PsiF family protein [Rhodocyclaceae bacterium]|nr:PsiF family protein [Rhodocyclaceae bacterium]
MNRMTALVAASLFALVAAPAAMATPQQDKMKACNIDAKDKKGDERKAFMKSCLSAGKSAEKSPAASACAAKAVSKDGKPLAGAAKSSFMKKCEKEAAAH